MTRKLLSVIAVALLVLYFAGSAFAEEIKGKITKVESGGKSITVKAKDKEVTVRISGSRTTLEGVGDRSGLKEGQSVTMDYEGDSAKKISVKKSK